MGIEDQIRSVVHDELRSHTALPYFVHQRVSEKLLSIPPREYLTAAHANAFPWTKERRLIIARTADVIAWLDRRISHRGVKPANDSNAETIALGRVGARRVAG